MIRKCVKGCDHWNSVLFREPVHNIMSWVCWFLNQKKGLQQQSVPPIAPGFWIAAYVINLGGRTWWSELMAEMRSEWTLPSSWQSFLCYPWSQLTEPSSLKGCQVRCVQNPSILKWGLVITQSGTGWCQGSANPCTKGWGDLKAPMVKG